MAEYPKFWEQILNRLGLQSFEGMENIRIILNFMGYTTLQSIAKLRKPKELSCFQIEVAKLNTNSQFCTDYPDLQNWRLGLGTIEIIKDISNAANSCMSIDIDNLDSVEDDVKKKVFERCVKVAPNLLSPNIMVNLKAKPICEIVCPFDLCKQVIKLSLIKQIASIAPPKFNTYNFERHINTLHAVVPNKKRKRDGDTIESMFHDEKTILDTFDCEVSRDKIVSSTPNGKQPEGDFVTPKTANIRKLTMDLSMANKKIEELKKNVSNTESASESMTPKSIRIEKLSNDLSVAGKITSELLEANVCLRHKIMDMASNIRTICRIKPDTTGDCFDWYCSKDGTNIQIRKNQMHYYHVPFKFDFFIKLELK